MLTCENEKNSRFRANPTKNRIENWIKCLIAICLSRSSSLVARRASLITSGVWRKIAEIFNLHSRYTVFIYARHHFTETTAILSVGFLFFYVWNALLSVKMFSNSFLLFHGKCEKRVFFAELKTLRWIAWNQLSRVSSVRTIFPFLTRIHRRNSIDAEFIQIATKQ